MTDPRDDVPLPDRGDDADLPRVTEEVAGRLRSSGVETFDGDAPGDLARLLDAVEEFERVVADQGGDLMVDEPPRNEPGEPDDPAFRIPPRAADESALHYLARLRAASEKIRLRRG